jgi:non-specific serine/threonine protein kinase
VADPALVLPATAGALGVTEAGAWPLRERVRAFLRPRQFLLLLDNCEHVVDGAAELVAELLDSCPALQVLATSRSPLRVRGEQILMVPPLALPAREETGDRPPPAVADLERVEAVALFVQRARAVEPCFALTEANAGAVAEVCRRLDGLPLAIELAAARARLLSPAALLALLSDRFRVLTGGPRDAPARQRTLWHAVAWSHDQLDADARALFRRLSIFVGGWDLPAAVAVGGGDPFAVLEGLEALCDQSLLVRADGPAGHEGTGPRYGMLETVREFAGEQLEASGEADAVRATHAAFFADRAEQEAAGVLSADQVAALDRLRADDGNLRAALAWLERGSDPGPFVALAAALGEYWATQSRYAEGRRWLERALAVGDRAPLRTLARALSATAALALFQGDYPSADAHFGAALTLGVETDDPLETARILTYYGILAYRLGEDQVARERLERALATFRSAGPAASGKQFGLIAVLTDLGDVTSASGELAVAAARYEEAAALARAGGFEWMLCETLAGLGNAVLLQGDVERAEALYRQALHAAQRFGDKTRTAGGLVGLAAVAAARGHHDLAARRLGGAEARYTVAGAVVFRRDRPVLERASTLARAALGEERFDAARRVGRTEPLASLTAEADDAPGASVDDSLDLTPREREILRLLARRQTDREIADALFVSHRTINGHVARIFGKLGVNNRREAAALAVRDGLV